MDIIAKIAQELGIRNNQAEAAIKLIDEGCTIPFIARYRKEATGALNDEVLRNLYDRLIYLRNLEDKKQTVLASIEEQGKLTEELKKQILAAETQVAVEICTVRIARSVAPALRLPRKKALSHLPMSLCYRCQRHRLKKRLPLMWTRKKAWSP